MKIKLEADEGRSVKVRRHGRRQEKPQQSKEPRRPTLDELRSDDALREEEKEEK